MEKKNIKYGVILIVGVFVCAGLFMNYIKNGINVKKIEKVTIKYYPGYNISTAEGLNSVKYVVDPVSFELNNQDRETAIKFLSKIKPTKFNFKKCKCVYIMDEYEIYLNDTIKISIGEQYGTTDKFIFDVKEDFYNFIVEITEKYNN